MITTIIVVDLFVEDSLYNIINILKKSSCIVLKMDIYSTTKDNIHSKIQEFITVQMETHTVNIVNILFFNFDIVVNNIDTEAFIGEVSKLYNLELHDPEYKSWSHLNDCFVTLKKTFDIENVDFIDINHLIHYDSYLPPLNHIEKYASENESFPVKTKYLSKFCSLEESELIKTSTNWLYSLFRSLYSQNAELKSFIDMYFQLNDTNLSFLENQMIDSLNIFSKEFVEYRQNSVVNTGSTSEAHILLIPTHYYENDLEGLLTVMEGSLKDKCYIGLIHEDDNLDDINELNKNIVDKVHGISDAPTININILCHIPKNVGADEVALNKDMALTFQEDGESINTLKDILTPLSENPKVNSVVFGLSNTPEKEKGDALKYFQEVMSYFESSNTKIIMDEVPQSNENLYKPMSASYLSHHNVIKNGKLMKEVKQSRILEFVSESSFDTFTLRSQLNQLILFDASLSQYLPEVYASITSDTEILVYRYDETFDELKQKILRLNQLPNVSFSNISLFKRDPQSFYFSLFDEEQSLKQDVEKDTVYGEEIIEQMLSQTDEELGIDLSLNTREEFIEDIYKSKAEYYLYYNGPDPSLNTWEKFSDFLMFLQDDIKVENFDILTCQIVGDDWEYILNNLQSRLNNMTIHSSIDTTGHTMFHGDWILETPENKNLVGIYFNDNIYDVEVKLDSEVFTDLDTLKYAIRNYARVIPYSGTGYIPPIENWVIKITHLSNICAHLISDLRHSLYPCEFSKIDGMSQWDISYVTNLDNAFANSNTNNLFNVPIGNWNTVNVTSMIETFSHAFHFDQDLSNWKTDNVTSMYLMFNKAHTFNQNLSTWNVSNVKSMNQMFRYSYSFNGNISGWTVDNVTDMQYMFSSTYSFDQDLSNWNVTSNLSSYPTKLDSMFRTAPGFTKVLTGDWENVPYDTRIDQNMFGWHADHSLRTPQTQGHINIPYDPVTGFTESGELKCALQLYFKNNIYAESLFGEIGTWNIENITHLNYLFTNNYPKNSNPPNLNNWNTSNVVDMEGTFKDAEYFNQPLDKWDVSKVTNMKDMFNNAKHFNQDLSAWDTQQVTDMTNMLYGCKRFNWYIGNWDTNNVTSTTNMFSGADDYNAQFVNTGYAPDMTVGTTTVVLTTLNYPSVDSTFIPLPSSVTSIDQINMVLGYIQGTAQQSPAFTGVYKVPNKYEWIIYSDHGDYFKMIKAGASVVDGVIGINTIAEAFIHRGNWLQASLSTKFKYVVLYRAQSVEDFNPSEYWKNSIQISEVRCFLNDGTNVLLATNGTTATFSTDFTHNHMVASPWSQDNSLVYNGVRGPEKMIDGIQSDEPSLNSGQADSQFVPVHWIATLSSEQNLSDINYIDVDNSRTGDAQWRAAGLQILLLNSNYDVVATSSVISTASDLYTFNSSELNYKIYRYVNNTTFNDALAIVPAGPTGGQTNSTAYGLKNLQVNIEKTVGAAFSNKGELQTALAAWKADRSAAQTQYGHISTWDVSSVSDFSGLFQQSFTGTAYAGVPFSEDLNDWNTGNVTNMSNMFYNCTYANPKITNWDTTNVTDLNSCFYKAREFCQDLSWNTGNVTNMSSTFRDARYSFNGDITNWNTENVTNMYLMFADTHQFNRNLSNWNVYNVTNFAGMFQYAECINQVFTGPSWTNITERLGIQTNMLGSPLYADQRVSIGFVNNSNVLPDNIKLLRQVCKLFCQHRAAALINYPDISQWDFSNVTNINNLFHFTNGIYPNNLDIGNWNVTNVTSMNYVFPSVVSLNIDFSGWDVSNVTDMTQMFTSCTYAKLNTIENWNVSNVTSFTAMFASCYSFNAQLDNWAIDSAINLNSMFSNCYMFNSDIGDWDLSGVLRTDSMFYNCYSFNKDVSSWNVRSLTQVNNMFYGCNVFRIDLSDWVLESVTVYVNIWYFLQQARSYEIVLGKTWTVLHEQFGKTRDLLVYRIFFNESPGTISTIPYNAPKVSFNSSNISNNTTYESDEIDVNLVVNTEVTESVGIGDLQITNGTVKNFYRKSQLEYTFVFTSDVFGQSSQITVNSNSTSLSDYIVEEPFVWTWSPPVTVMTFNSPDISNNQTQTSSSINVEINLSREFLTNAQLIQKEDISVTNGTVTGFQRIDNTQYVFTFIASSPNLDSIIEMESAFDASNTILPSTFTWTWIANIEQPALTLTSTDVADGGTIKKNEVDMLLTYTPNSKLAFASMTETDISFTNGFIVSNSFGKKTPTQYSFKFKSLSRDTDSTIYIPQNQFQYNFVDGATNLTENYEGSSVFTWKYNGLDIKLINNKTVAVITSEQKDSKSLDLILHGNTTYDPVYNEYNFEKSTSDYITISGEILNGSGEASISFWYKTKTTANTSFATLLTLRNDDNDNFTLQRYAIQDKFHIKSTGSSAINAVTTNLPYYNTNYVHMVVTFTSTEILVYKNSVLEETHSISNVVAGGERAFQMLGASVSSANVVYRYFNGYIKNLRFYNYAIPLTEVSALYTMYNTGMNDTAPQILSVNLTTTNALTNNEFPKAVINMEMDVTYDSVASISSIDTQSFIIDKSNFDTSFGYVFDFRQLSDTKVSFKFGASTTIYNSQLFLKQDTITRNINSNLNVVSNPESNVFTWKYKSEPLTIQSIKSNIGNTGSLINQEVIWIQVIFSEEVFNFRKDYITGTNCKVIKTTGSGTTYAVKVQTFRPTSASIVIDIPSTLPITTGKGLNKALADANNATYNWDYDNIIPTFTIETSRESGLTNNADYVDITVVTSRSTTTFDIDSLNVNGSAEIVNFSGSGQNYSYRLQPFASSEISVTLPSNAFSDDYGNKNTTLDTFTWTYHNIKPEVYIASQDINSGDSADLGSIETYFVFNKPVSGFTLADVDITNGNLSELTQSTTFPEHENTYTVTIGSKASANNPYASKGSSNAFFLNGEEAKVVSFVAGNTYTFNNASNSAHPLKFYTDAEKTSGSEYTTGVTVSATSTIIVVDSNTPTTLYYQCEAHDYMGNMITYGESYKATLIPASSSVSISLQIADNKVKDSLGIFNDAASNNFVWNYTGTEYMVSIESPDLKSGASHLYKSIQVSLTLTYATFDTVDVSIFTIVNGTITNIVDQGSGSYTFTLESVTPNTETSLLLPENSVTRYDNNSEGNKASNKFVWTYTPPIPQLTITSSDVKQGAFTNNSSIDLQLEFTENVDVSNIIITNGSGTLSGANNSYVLTVVPDVVVDSSADILVSFPEDTGFYNYFDNEELYNDVSYNYSWKYDSIIPTGTIVSSISDVVYQDVCSNVQDVPFTIEFNKNMPSLIANNFTISANGALSGLSGSGSLYSFVISALDNTIDNTISFKLGDGVITDKAGNAFSSSNEFSFTITAKVSKVLETAAIAELFTDDADIAEEDKLSADEINMVLAVEIPDLTVPDFDEDGEESGEVTADVSYTVTVDTKTSSNSYFNQGSSSAYFIDGTEAPTLALDQDNVYRFNQDDATNSGHPLLFYEDVDKSIQFTTDVSVNGTPGSADAYTQISITSETPTTLYYQCGNHDYMGGTITIGEVDTVPVISLPPAVKITNNKVFTRLIDQILEKAEDVTAIKMGIDDVTLSDTATEKIPEVEEVIMAKSNQIEPPVVIENTGTDSVLFVPLANEGDLVKVEIDGIAYLTVVNADKTFGLKVDGVDASGSPFSKDDVYVIDDTNSIIFGSQIISSSPPPPSPPTVEITSTIVQTGGTTTTGSIELDLSFSTTIDIDLANIYPLTNSTQITNTSIQSVDSSNSVVVVSVSPIFPDVSADLGIIIYDTTFYSLFNDDRYYNDISFSFSWNYDSTVYNNANVVEVIEEYEPVFIDTYSGIIPCFLKDTNVLTTKGYKKVQNLVPGKDKLIDHKNNIIECLEVKKYVKQNDGKEYSHRIPRGSQLSKDFVCNQDLFLTYNHCVYLPSKNMFSPVAMMKNIKQHITSDPHFVYYHVFTDNYFADTIIANGIPCESHSKYTFRYLRELDSSGKLLKKIMRHANMMTNCQRNRISRKDYKKLIKKSKRNIKNKKQPKK